MGNFKIEGIATKQEDGSYREVSPAEATQLDKSNIYYAISLKDQWGLVEELRYIQKKQLDEDGWGKTLNNTFRPVIEEKLKKETDYFNNQVLKWGSELATAGNLTAVNELKSLNNLLVELPSISREEAILFGNEIKSKDEPISFENRNAGEIAKDKKATIPEKALIDQIAEDTHKKYPMLNKDVNLIGSAMRQAVVYLANSSETSQGSHYKTPISLENMREVINQFSNIKNVLNSDPNDQIGDKDIQEMVTNYYKTLGLDHIAKKSADKASQGRED